MKAQEIMTENPICCAPNDTIRDAAELMREHDCGCIPVVEDQLSKRLVGVVTDRDLTCRALAEGLSLDAEVETVMTRDPVCCTPDADLKEVERIMAEAQVRRVPVRGDEDRCVGIVAQADLALAEGHGVTSGEVGRVVGQISRPTHPREAGAGAYQVPLM